MPEKWLYLLRHAKSDWEDSRKDDHDRPLAPRGQAATSLIAAHLLREGISPELILCSSARRTRETLEGVAPGRAALIERELYSAGPREILARLHRVPSETRSVMVIGHNPAMHVLALRLAGASGRSQDGTPLADVERKFPTGGLASFRFDGPWEALEPGGAELTAFVRPKALRESALE